MTHILRFGLAIVLTLFAAFGYADPPARAARLAYVHGTVSFAPAPAPQSWSVAVPNRPLTAGDRLWTDRDGYAEMRVGSTAVRLAPRTNVDLLTLDDDTLQLRLAQGDVNVRVRDVAEDTIEIGTPNGAILLEEAGSYRISAGTDGDMTNVVVHSGRAHVLAPSGSFSVRGGQHVTLHGPEGTPSEFQAASRDAFDRWSTELDRRDDQIVATRYVSPRMTGYEDLDEYGTWRTLPEYGAVWVPRVSPGWAPYRHGHWVWIEPWGWSWVDDAPWGFAPFHYGRWVWLNNYWAWAPGPRIARPVYAPALVAFVGGSNWSVSIGSGPAVGWFPLGWREPYLPWYRASPAYVRNVNVTHVQNINVYNNVTRINYVNRSVPQAVTVVPREAFVSARPVARSVVALPANQATRAPLVQSLPAEPVPSSFAARRAESRPPESAVRREVFAARPPRGPAVQNQFTSDVRPGSAQTERAETAAPRVRVIERRRADADAPATREEFAPPAVSRPGGPEETARPQARPQPEPGRRAGDDGPQLQAPGVQRTERAGPDRTRESRMPEMRQTRPATPDPSQAKRAAPDPSQARRGPTRADDEQDRRGLPGPAARPEPRAQREPRVDADRSSERRPRVEQRQPRIERPRTENERRSEREPRVERRESQAERDRVHEAPARPARRIDAESPRERRSAPAEARSSSREPRSEIQSAPRAAARQDAVRASRPAPQGGPHAAPPRAQAPRVEARGPHNASAPRAGGRPERENRRRND